MQSFRPLDVTEREKEQKSDTKTTVENEDNEVRNEWNKVVCKREFTNATDEQIRVEIQKSCVKGLTDAREC